ncbi:MAG: glutaredoxin family protein [Pirellulales bacterium]|nr:glutaredoxin family protein [Pirellulales bacterium]
MATLPADQMQVALYTRRGCHLCDQALDLLQRRGLTVQLIDISQSEELTNQYGLQIPVVEIDGRVRFRGHVQPLLLQRLINHAAACVPNKT